MCIFDHFSTFFLKLCGGVSFFISKMQIKMIEQSITRRLVVNLVKKLNPVTTYVPFWSFFDIFLKWCGGVSFFISKMQIKMIEQLITRRLIVNLGKKLNLVTSYVHFWSFFDIFLKLYGGVSFFISKMQIKMIKQLITRRLVVNFVKKLIN